MPVDTISVRPSSEKTTKEVRIETQRTRGVTPSWELWETAGGKLARSYLAADGTLHLQTNDGVGGGWVDIPYDNTNMLPFFDGQFLQITDVDVVEDTGAVKLQIQKNGGGDLQIAFSSVWYTLDCTPVAEMTLTAGTDIAPQLNYVYITESGGVLTLTKSTSGWPDGTAFAAVATVVVQSAASLAIDGPMKLQVWTDHVESNGINGHLSHITRRLRYSPALWEDGVVPADMAVVDPNAYLSVSSGEAFQLHRLTFPALDMATGDPVFVVNDPTTAYKRITTLDDVTQDSSGGGINNKYLNLVLWGIINQNESECKLMLNLPSGTYTSEASAISDDENKADYTIPSDFTGTGFLIARYTVRAKDSGAWTQSAKADLRGLTPSSSPGGAGASSGNVIGPASATDNAVVRYDGATGKLLQDSGVLLDDSGALTVPDQTADPATPAAGFSTIWVSDGTGSGAAGDVMSIDSAGAVDNLTAASAVASPVTLTSGAAGEIPLTIVAHASQSANMTEWEDSANVVGAHVTLSQEFHHSGGGVNSCIYGSGAGVDSDEPRCTSVGVSAICYGDDAVAIGYGAVAGSSASTTHQNNVAIGSGASAAVSSGVAIGQGAVSDVSGGTAIGFGSSVTGNSSVAIGSSASCTGAFGVAIGQGVTNSGSGVSIGNGASGPTSIGYNATSSHGSSIAIGTFADASVGTAPIAIGVSAVANHSYSICIGRGATSTAANQLVIGGEYVGLKGIKEVYIGEGVTHATPEATTYNATGGSGTDIIGADLTLAAGKATGNAAGGEVTFEASVPGSTGTTLQALTEKIRVGYDGMTLVAQSNTPGTPASGECVIYMKGSKYIIAYDDVGTVRYKYLDLAGTGVTWVHTTSAP